ncbi:ras GTPase-activating protein [Piromyces finnis]|uniref:Ras GTPase-activating protein n=1 Tax=Piromyces finnis TaxID=1754191 RepID=A0A1Y1VQM9_9FUNG|nr:ras GTPase-activating protein [Piromyces finnis]|eukprot:ORX61161.1 ras GTPase-activating protein [Piromyces finnis]
MLCSTLVFNESVSSLSSPILSIIKYVDEQKHFISEENFIIMLLMNKVAHFENKRKNITDLLRDNSIPIMLLNNYTKEKGQSYLVETLGGPMEKILPMIFKCEIDPQKIESQVIEDMKKKNEELINESDQYKNIDVDDNENEMNNKISEEEIIDKEEVKKQVDSILKENTQNIQKSCTLLLKAITTSKKIMPSGFKSICQSLAYVIQKIYEEDNFFFSPDVLNIFDEEIYVDNNIDDNSSTGSEFLKSNASSDEESSFNEENIKRKRNSIKNGNTKKSVGNLCINTKILKHSYQNCNDNCNYSNKTSDSMELINLCPPRTATSEYSIKIKLPTHMHDSFESYDDLSSDFSSSESESSSSTISCSSIKLFIPSYEEKSAGNYLIHDNDINSEIFENGSDTKEESYHANEESSIQSLIIGTLLFLRFFIPAITSPDLYSIVPNKLSMDYRRGLILCGKVLTAMCNDVEFGGKEQYMTCFNNFLHEKKFDLQEFISWTILPDKNDV